MLDQTLADEWIGSAADWDDVRTPAVEAISVNPFLDLEPQFVVRALLRWATAVGRRPDRVAGLAPELVRRSVAAWLRDPAASPGELDRRFRDPAWDGELWRRLAHQYLAAHGSLDSLVAAARLDEKSALRARYALGLLGDALNPANGLLSNPVALRRAVTSRGGSIARGLRHWLDDVRHNGGLPSLADRSRFTVGRDLAATPGDVVLRTSRFELLYYHPAHHRTTVAEPVLFVPSQVNKFYVVDLTTERSLVRRLLKDGFAVFAVSWRNPSPEHRDWGRAEYAASVREALLEVTRIRRAPGVHVVGMCAGGATVAAALADPVATEQHRSLVRTVSLLMSVLDTRSSSSMAAFATSASAQAASRRSARSGIASGQDLSRGFAWMRPNELIWSLWVSSYLLGEPPPANAVLYWSQDVANLPAALHRDYLQMYVDNPLVAAGSTIDLSLIRGDAYVFAGTTDHISPWDGALRSCALLGGPATFVLGRGGHIQSLMTSPGRPGAQYAVGDDPVSSCDPDHWAHHTPVRHGSWWDHWAVWLTERSTTPDAVTEDEPVTRLGPAPGLYVVEPRP